MKSQSKLTKSDKSNSDNFFQGRTRKHVENNNRVTWIAVLMLASIIALIVIANKCSAQDVGYRWCISDSAGLRCDNTTQLHVAIDSISVVSNTPCSAITSCLENSRYYLSETDAFTVYIERKRIVRYRKNGNPILRKLKRQK